jgi:transcription elongation factor S-II
MVATIESPTEFRQKIAKEIFAILKEIDSSDNRLSVLSQNIERAVYNGALNNAVEKRVVRKWDNSYFVHIYIDRLRSIYANLKMGTLGKRLINREVSTKQLATMTHQEMGPEKWKELIQKKMERDEEKYTPKTDGNTDDFTCRCGSTKCHAYQLQTRSADEPMTTFVSCLSCGKRWKC